RRSWSFYEPSLFAGKLIFNQYTCHHIALVTYIPHASKTIDNSGDSLFAPDSNHHKRKKTKTFGLDVSVTGQIG
ncbi:hypothetical protein, partial [Segatella baroniae]|uniref:hypothetical protein n=2 Tax=Segatella baroniae TaxID=305719 RepID=UPI0005C44134